jgi:hypothetical protein
MSRRVRTRMHHPRRAAINNMEIASSRARKLSRHDIDQQMGLVRQAVAEFCRGEHCAHHWRSLADTCNMAETLAWLRLGSGEEVDQVISNAQQVLHDVHQRHAAGGSWTLYADEIDALLWLAPLHQVQLEVCSYGEFETAYRRTANRVSQAMAGNAAAGTIVVVGDIHPLEAVTP